MSQIKKGEVIAFDYGKHVKCETCEHIWPLRSLYWNTGEFTGECRFCALHGADTCSTCLRKWPNSRRFWRDNRTTCKQCEDNARRKSRNDAKFFRRVIIDGCRGRCEVCNTYCEHIAHIHHIVPVEEGGSGDLDNLVCLCPNCHETVHWLQREQSDYRAEFIMQIMPDANFDLLQQIVSKQAPLKRDGKS